ncbi:MAG: hypothetical protein QXY87_14080 [Saccharolobus sp.]|uniref:hypothetical protein n=1 Tax=Saccharolobus TaxID=2100760 RepID=UPI001F0FFF8D|nr:hypothetical protein [Saccharolobus shibatae]MCH4816803.1 hypothetical protein [Saccharolobus shibatae]
MTTLSNDPAIFNIINSRITDVWNNLDILIKIMKNNKISIYNINSSDDIDLTTQGFGVIGSGAKLRFMDFNSFRLLT